MAGSSLPLDCGLDLEVFSLVMACLYFIIFIPALLLNLVTAYISWTLKAKSSFIVYLKSLVVADLLMTLIIPLKAFSELPGATQGLLVIVCHFRSLFYLCLHISILLMGLISLDRFFKIVKPGGKRLGHSARFGKVAVVTIWTVFLSVNTIPNMIFNSEKPSNSNSSAELCMSLKTDLGKQYHAVVSVECSSIFLVVSLIIGFCYLCIARRVIESHQKSGSTNVKGRRKIKARVFVILVVFVVCFAPYHITRFPYIKRQVENKINCHWASMKIAKSITLWLATTNVCLDPLIYFLLCRSFRRKLYKLKIHWSTIYDVNTQETKL